MTCPAEGTPESDPAWARQLLGHLRPAGRDTGKVVAWLAGTVRGTVALTDASGRLLAGEPVPVDDALTDDLVRGRIASAAWDGRGRHVRLVRVDLPATPGVLTVARTAPFDREAADAVTHTAAVLEVLLRARGSTETEDRLRRAAADLRLAILQLLMVEDTVSARRVAAGLWPGLLDTDTACVYVVEGRAEDRDTLADECLAATGGRPSWCAAPPSRRTSSSSPPTSGPDPRCASSSSRARTPTSAAAPGRASPAPPARTGRPSARSPSPGSAPARPPSTPNAATPNG
ncbi:hypothetical protein GCM10020256_72600 [Streptomyces thermocoprophilus]